MDRKSAVHSAQLKYLYSNVNVGLISGVLLATTLVFMQRDVTSTYVLLYWLAAVIFVSLFRATSINRYKQANAADCSSIHVQLISFRLGVLIAGLIWGSAGVLMFHNNNPQQQLFLMFILAGVSAGSLITYSSDVVSTILYSVTTTTPIIIQLMLQGDRFSLAMSFSLIVYLSFMILNARHNHLSINDNIVLRLDAIEREHALSIRNEWHQAILEGVMDGYWLVDIAGKLQEVNATYCKMSGYSSQELLSMHISDLEAVDSKQEISARIQKIMAEGEDSYETKHRRKDGSMFDVEMSIQYRLIEGGQFVVFLHDITQRKQAADKIEKLAYYDPLTNLPNRRMLIDHIHRAMSVRMRTHRDGAILFLDLDHFKTLNDSLGHAIGDMLLEQVAGRLTTCLRENDTIARLGRLGGDEFVVLLEYLSSNPVEAASQAEIVVKKIHATLTSPYHLATHEYKGTVSIGVALFSDHDASKEDLLKHADIAMYQAKKDGRNGMCFFDPMMQVAINKRANLEQELSIALEQQQFQLHYQAQVNESTQATGAEALIRWAHPERGEITPFNFISLAEETGLILPIGNWVLDAAYAQLKKWERNPATQHLTLSINVSAKQFHQANFTSDVMTSLQRHHINPRLLKLELTESMLLENIEDTIETMVILGDIGVRFALDDFGTGYSSLQYLKRLPLYQLKIDQSLTRDIVDDSSDEAIVRTIIAMANSLNLEVIAEGVETDEQLTQLINYGCKNFQGYLFGKPMPIEQFETTLPHQSIASHQPLQ